MKNEVVHQAHTRTAGKPDDEHLVLRDKDGVLALTVLELRSGIPSEVATIHLSPAQLAELGLAAASLASAHASDANVHDEEHWLNERVLAWQEKNRQAKA